MKREKTPHEKKVELAEASTPRYGVYVDGGNSEAISENMAAVMPYLSEVLNSDNSPDVKIAAMKFLKKFRPSTDNLQLSNINVEM